MVGNTTKPTAMPTMLPRTLAAMPYSKYLPAILTLEYPSALRVPICRRFSSTMRVMVVEATSAATRKKNTGNTRAMAAIRSAYCSSVTRLRVLPRSSTYHSPFWMSAIFSSASLICCWPSASFCSASAFWVSYSVREASSCSCPDWYCAQPSSSWARAASNWV